MPAETVPGITKQEVIETSAADAALVFLYSDTDKTQAKYHIVAADRHCYRYSTASS